MKKLFNLRIPVLMCCSFILGITLGCLLFFYNKDTFLIGALILTGAAVLILFAVIFGHAKLFGIIALICLFMLFGLFNCYLRLHFYTRSELDDGGSYHVSATVVKKGENSRGQYLVADDIRVDGKCIGGKITINLGETYGDFCNEGYKINFYATINKNPAFSYAKLTYNAERDIRYTSNVYGGLKAEYSFSLFGSIRAALRERLYENLDRETAAVALAMLTGDTQDVDGDELETFRYGGIAHIFAVSGLHIGIIYGLFVLLCKKLRFNKYTSAAVCIFFIFFYAGICAFTISSLRAAIMCAVNSLARLAHKKYDSLNSLAAAVFLILCATPLSLFSVGFQLSACAVLGIIMLSIPIRRSLRKLPAKISSSVGVSLSAQAGTLPVMLSNFGYISGEGLILNIFIVPLLSAIFAIIFASALISLVLPFAAPVILPNAVLLLQLFLTCFIKGGFERALISGFGAGAALIPYYLLLLILSVQINLPLLRRIAAAGCAATVLFGCIAANRLLPVSGYKICVSAYYGGGQVLIKTENVNVLIITEGLNTSRLRPFLNENYVTVPDAVIILGGENCVMKYDYNLNCKNVYVFQDYIHVQPYDNVNVRYEKQFYLGNAGFEFADGRSLAVTCGKIKAAVCAGEIPFDDCDIVISDTFCPVQAEYTVGFNRRGNQSCVYDGGNVVFTIKEGKIKRLPR